MALVHVSLSLSVRVGVVLTLSHASTAAGGTKLCWWGQGGVGVWNIMSGGLDCGSPWTHRNGFIDSKLVNGNFYVAYPLTGIFCISNWSQGEIRDLKVQKDCRVTGKAHPAGCRLQ